jgi:hypothetical protein
MPSNKIAPKLGKEKRSAYLETIRFDYKWIQSFRLRKTVQKFAIKLVCTAPLSFIRLRKLTRANIPVYHVANNTRRRRRQFWPNLRNTRRPPFPGLKFSQYSISRSNNGQTATPIIKQSCGTRLVYPFVGENYAKSTLLFFMGKHYLTFWREKFEIFDKLTTV